MTEDISVSMARFAERAERFDDMADFMKERIEKNIPLSSEERDMFSAAFKNALAQRRHAVRIAHSVAHSELGDGEETTADLATSYKTKVEAELQFVCSKALRLIEEFLLPSVPAGDDSRTFYLKMQGDYYRYLAEFAQADARVAAATKANAAYQVGMQEARQVLPVAHPVHLGLALNFSVFQHEVLGETESAVQTAISAVTLAEQAFDEGGQEDPCCESRLTIDLLKDNLKLWRGKA